MWHLGGGRTLDLSARAEVMGILNVTPDSFSDGGAFLDGERALPHALAMLDEGAALIDVGGESTRPGALPVSADEEIRRVVPVVAALVSRRPGCLVSVDTSKAAVARAALEHGAAIINDVTALRGDPAMAGVIAEHGAGVVLMHMQGEPRTMQLRPTYADVVREVREFFEERLAAADAAGVPPERVALDPGIGFGKTVAHNLTLLRELPALVVGDRPLVLGVSRKSFLAKITGAQTIPERLWPTVALTAASRERGARILRVHEVRPNLLALRAVEAMLDPSPSPVP